MPPLTLHRTRRTNKYLRAMVVLVGIMLGQFVLYGPSLTGQKILLPLDILAGHGFYLPRTPETVALEAKDGSAADLVVLMEPARRFALSEIQAGREPRWTPYEYAGAPFIVPNLSPLSALALSIESPVVLAWIQMLVALIGGGGAYLFFRKALRISFWPAAICAWCYPLTGFFVFWEGFPLVQPVCWLPWLLLAIEGAITAANWYGSAVLALVTCMVASNQLDIAGQVLLVSGLYAICRLLSLHFRLPGWAEPSPAGSGASFWRGLPEQVLRFWRSSRRAVIGLLAGWTLGLLLVTPYVLPVLEYAATGGRMAHRAAGTEERPPGGLKTSPQVVMPDIYGTRQEPSLRYDGGPQMESSAGAYAGLLITLLGAPLAFCSRRHRAFNTGWVLLGCVTLAWCLNLPGIVSVLRLPGLNMMSHNRLVFGAAFGILALAATGLDALVQGPISWRRWMWLPLGVTVALCLGCLYRSVSLPEPIATQIPKTVAAGQPVEWIRDLQGVQRLQGWFAHYYAAVGILCGIGALGWILVRSRQAIAGHLVPVCGVLFLGELLWFAHGRNAQCDRALYYPSVPVLEAIAKAPPGRVMGFDCLPAKLSTVCGLPDIRGYDGIDPARMVELVASAADPLSRTNPYSATMRLSPKGTITPAGEIQLSPILDMLGVRYVIFRGAPFPGARPLFQGVDYWVLKNSRALARVFVPEKVEMVTNDCARLEKLCASQFNPAEIAYVEAPAAVPDLCRGTATIEEEVPTRIIVSVRMETAGLVVLSDQWHPGWKAYLDQRRVPILRANHALRGVIVPEGSHRLEFRYEPASYALGCGLAWASALILVCWTAWAFWKAKLQVRRLVIPTQQANPSE